MENPLVAKRLGLGDCQASIPLTPGEAVEMGKNLELYPNPESDPEWGKLVELWKTGDELRLMSCKDGDPYFYALFRGNVVIFKYHLASME